ncbi:MAG: secondary thiamine-phosphate synthase enzyme YjbQ [Thermoleophilia bacterium]|nr:secondary thiamine-phosphate synthase enzyme YjbQ [Thermoleophilia bacterium]
MHELRVATPAREILVDITAEVEKALTQLATADEGLLWVFVPHTTAGATINEGADPAVARDITTTLNRLVPRRGDYRHGEGNSDAHVKTSLIGSSLLVPFSGGRLRLGTWQSIYLAEFDGPRTRRVWVGVVSPSDTGPDKSLPPDSTSL